MGLSQPSHIAILLAIVLLLFGAKRLPEMGRALGSGMREFKDAVTGNSPEPPAELPPAEPVATPSEHETSL
jgi:sec-independent protein translocase protein TatA